MTDGRTSGMAAFLQMAKIIVPNTQTLCFLIFLFLSPAATDAQQSNSSDPHSTNISVNSHLAPPPSDGCTMWFDGDFKDCCVEHDRAYLTGGDHWRTRLRADNRLFTCVAGKKGAWHLALAPVMWTGVRIFGSDLSPSSRQNVIHRFFKRAFALSKKMK